MPSLNVLLTSTCWRNDHNGFSHQGPGLLDTVIPLGAGVVRAWLPPDQNCLLSIADHCFRSRNHVNLIVADKQPHLQYLTADEAAAHCERGGSVWDWAGTEKHHGGSQPDVILACIGDVPTMEMLAAAQLLAGMGAGSGDARRQRRRPDGDDAAGGAPARLPRHRRSARCSAPMRTWSSPSTAMAVRCTGCFPDG